MLCGGSKEKKRRKKKRRKEFREEPFHFFCFVFLFLFLVASAFLRYFKGQFTAFIIHIYHLLVKSSLRWNSLRVSVDYNLCQED